MKVIILSCNTGGGHNSAARAISRKLDQYGIRNDIVDALKFTPYPKKIFIENGHSLAYRYVPELYGEVYVQTENIRNHDLLYLDYAKYAVVLAAYIRKHRYDVAICTHEFPSFMLTEARKTLKFKIKQYFVITDYCFAPGIEMTSMDGWFIPKGFTQEYVEAGIPEDRIVETGIPVDEDYYTRIRKSEARKALGIRNDMKVILIGAGSIGCGQIDELALKLKSECDDVVIAVLCGNNRSLQKKLARYVEDGTFLPIGFTSRVREWLSAADIYVTKAGGLSTTEAASMNIPMVFIDAVQGLETHNLNYFVNNGCGITGSGIDDLCRRTIELLDDEAMRKDMVRNQRRLFSSDAVADLVECVIDGF